MRRLLPLALLLLACAPPREGEPPTLQRELAGLAQPASALSDPAHAAWSEDAETRRALREALRELAVAEPLLMVRPDEPGEPLVLEGVLLDENDGRPLADALIEIVHADAGGQYFPEPDSDWNPRLFGFVRTAGNGGFLVRTIRPGGYSDDEGEPVAAHLHFNAESEGHRPFGGEIVLADDPHFTAKARAEALRSGLLVARPTRAADGTWRVRATIPLQPLP